MADVLIYWRDYQKDATGPVAGRHSNSQPSRVGWVEWSEPHRNPSDPPCGQANNPALWVVAQAMSEILPDGDKEKLLMQGLLNQKEKIEQAGQRGRMF